MSFLSRKNSEFLSARLTQKGRKSIAQGDFQIKFFQVGDSEFDYTSPFNLMDGVQTNPNQVVLSPFDKDSQVKYPYLLDSAAESTTYGVPIMDSITETIRNGMGPAGFVSEHLDYDSTNCSGTTIECPSVRIPFSGTTQSGTYMSGNTISFRQTFSYSNCNGTHDPYDIEQLNSFNNNEFITVVFNNQFLSEEQVVTGNSTSLIYRVLNVSVVTGTTSSPSCETVVTGQTTLTLDRHLPNFTTIPGYAQVVKNKCKIEHPLSGETATVCVSNQVDPSEQHDPWTLNVVWKEKPIGSDVDGVDESITGYTSSKHISTMEYLGYGSSGGQVMNCTKYTITNSTTTQITVGYYNCNNSLVEVTIPVSQSSDVYGKQNQRSTFIASGLTVISENNDDGYKGTEYKNSFGDPITVSPEQQRCIAIVHYSELGHIYDDPDRFFKYDDYIGSSTTEGVLVDEELVTDVDFFNVYIPFIYHESNTGTTMGALFTMDTSTDGEKTIDSSVAGTPGDIRTGFIRYRDLLDESGEVVGRVFMDKKIIVFHNQELVASLDYRSNRRYTLPTPKVYYIPSDIVTVLFDNEGSAFSGTIAQTYWVTYMLGYTGDSQLNGLPCNNFTKVQVNTLTGECNIDYPANIALKWGENAFRHMSYSEDSNFISGATRGYIADRLYVLVQETTNETELLPDPTQWTLIDITDKIPGTNTNSINPENLRNRTFTITGAEIEEGLPFDLEDYLKNNSSDTDYLGNTEVEPSSLPQFGDEQPFPGHVKLVRCTDIEEMRFLVNLPHSQWTTTQNPTYDSGTKYVTEVALLNQNKETLVTAKTSTPVKRVGTQVISVKIDF